MKNPLLLYDSKCQICRDLALKVQANAQGPLEILALSDPEAAPLLERHYPKGWKHDFYLIENGSCRRGVFALPKLVRILGPRKLGALVGQLASFKAEQARCKSTANGDSGPAPSRRQLVAMAAAAPFLAPLSKLAAMSGPLDVPLSKADPGIEMNLAVVWRDTAGNFQVDVRTGSQAIRGKGGFKKTEDEVRITHRDSVVLEKSAGIDRPAHEKRLTFPGRPAEPESAEFILRRNSLEGEKVHDGSVERRFVNSYSLGIDQPRYNVSLNVGNGTLDGRNGTVVATTLSGMVRHDLARPLIDFVVVAGDRTSDTASHFAAYLEGLKALRRYHAEAGHRRVAALYRDIEAGLKQAMAIYERNVTESMIPVKSKLVVTSMPELLQFVDYSAELSLISKRLPLPSEPMNTIVMQQEEINGGGCDCSCSCGCCCGCGCGCGCGLCGCSCVCFCCCECGCSCGCGCCL